MKYTVPLFFVLMLLPGCATRGGWPCSIWQKNTDQKLEHFSETNQPLPAVTGQSHITAVQPGPILKGLNHSARCWPMESAYAGYDTTWSTTLKELNRSTTDHDQLRANIQAVQPLQGCGIFLTLTQGSPALRANPGLND